MSRQKPLGKPTTRRYSDDEKDQTVRLVRKLREELGTDHGTVKRVADQLGYGVESVRKWVRKSSRSVPFDSVVIGVRVARCAATRQCRQSARHWQWPAHARHRRHLRWTQVVAG